MHDKRKLKDERNSYCCISIGMSLDVPVMMCVSDKEYVSIQYSVCKLLKRKLSCSDLLHLVVGNSATHLLAGKLR